MSMGIENETALRDSRIHPFFDLIQPTPTEKTEEENEKTEEEKVGVGCIWDYLKIQECSLIFHSPWALK